MNPERYRRLVAALDRRQPDLTVVMDGVHKSHNFSAVLRTCDAVGVFEAHAVPSPPGSMGLHTHVSGGSAKWVKVHIHPTIDEAVGAARELGCQVVAAHQSASSIPYDRIDFTRPTALILGSELEGMSGRGVELADAAIEIPMLGHVHSLNVSVAAAVILFEAMRQRLAMGLYDTPHIEGELRSRTLFEWGYPRIARVLRQRGEPYYELDEEGRYVVPDGQG